MAQYWLIAPPKVRSASQELFPVGGRSQMIGFLNCIFGSLRSRAYKPLSQFSSARCVPTFKQNQCLLRRIVQKRVDFQTPHCLVGHEFLPLMFIVLDLD